MRKRILDGIPPYDILALSCERVANPLWVTTAVEHTKNHDLLADDSIVNCIRKAPGQ